MLTNLAHPLQHFHAIIDHLLTKNVGLISMARKQNQHKQRTDYFNKWKGLNVEANRLAFNPTEERGQRAHSTDRRKQLCPSNPLELLHLERFVSQTLLQLGENSQGIGLEWHIIQCKGFMKLQNYTYLTSANRLLHIRQPPCFFSLGTAAECDPTIPLTALLYRTAAAAHTLAFIITARLSWALLSALIGLTSSALCYRERYLDKKSYWFSSMNGNYVSLAIKAWSQNKNQGCTTRLNLQCCCV